MIDAAMEVLRELGMNEERIFYDKFERDIQSPV
jgi:hypothetical protein